MENPNFLKKKYDLHNAPETEAAAKRAQKRGLRQGPGQMDEKVSQSPEARIQNYLDRFKEIVERKEPAKRERGIEALKQVLHNKFIIKEEEIPESYFDSIKKKHREEGHGDIEIPGDYRRELAETLIGDQEKSLDNWIDYLASDDAKYPDWLKYFTFRSVLKMGRLDKGKKSFTERYGKTVAPFADLNREALAIVLGDVEKYEDNKSDFEFTKRFDIKEESKEKYRQFLKQKNFAKLYALAIEEFKPIPEELLKITEGAWIKYPKGSDPKSLVKSISEYGTGWCIRGESMAERYLVRDQNDLYVYYSHDKGGQPTVPRVVMVINPQGKIAEIRGVEKDEHLDSFIGEVVDLKLSESEFKEEGKSYKKKSEDMKLLTEIESKTLRLADARSGQTAPLSKDDLVFLYEINAPIEGFGYQSDPRINEIRKARNPKEDMLVVLECSRDQVAENADEVNGNTRAYVGELFPGIFLKNIEHVYTSSPEGKIPRIDAEIGGRSKQEIIDELEKREKSEKNDKIYISDYVRSMLGKSEFFTLEKKEAAQFVRVKVRDLGFPNGATTEEIYEKAEDFGLELCPPEIGPQFRLRYEEIFKREQPRGEYIYVAMKQISGSGGRPGVFRVSRDRDGESWLGNGWAKPDDGWSAGDEFVFRLRPPASA